MSAQRRPWIDVVRDGLTPAELRGRGDTAVWTALRSTAMSAMQNGYGFPHWCATVLEPRSKLGAQACVRVGRGDQPRSPKDVQRQLATAWESAAKYVVASPAWTRDDVLAVVQELRDVLADSVHQLPDAEAAVLLYALDFAAEKGTSRPALPRRAVAAACKPRGVGERAARNAQRRLADAGVLRLAVRGRAGVGSATQTSGKASLYRLPTAAALHAYLCRGTRPVGPPQAQPHRPMGLPSGEALGRFAQTYGTPQPHPPLQEDDVQHMATLTVPLQLLPELAALVRAYEQRERGQQEADAENVVRLDRRGRGAHP